MESQTDGKRKNNKVILGVLIALVLLIAVMLIWFVNRRDTEKAASSTSAYEMGDMVVAVKISDAVLSLKDTGNYRYGVTYSPEESLAEQMVSEVEEAVGRELKIVTYNSPEELGEALVSGNVEAAIYNLDSTIKIAEVQEDYETQVRILYQHGQSLETTQETTFTAPFNVFISGIDTDGDLEKTSRSDVNIIATVNPETRQILLTTTPRDYYVIIPGISGETKDKLTHAGIYGVEASMDTLGALYDIEMDYYIRLNFSSMLNIIDDIGGISVYSEFEFDSGNMKGFHFYKGTNYMNGEQALAYVRERYAFQDGDNQRGRNQEAVLAAIIEKLLTPAALENATQLISKMYDQVETDFTMEQISALAARQKKAQTSWNVVSVSAVGTGDRQACYSMGSHSLYVMQPNEESVNGIKSKMHSVLAGETVTE
ncbi:MAG: LCP family protein [Lachnospiraceae bacterium]